MATSIDRLYSLGLDIYTNWTYRKQTLLGIVLVCLLVSLLLGSTHLWTSLHTQIHGSSFMSHQLDDHDPWG